MAKKEKDWKENKAKKKEIRKFEELLQPQSKISLKLKEEIKKENKLFLISTKAETQGMVFEEALKLLNSRLFGIIVSLNKPKKEIEKILKKASLNQIKIIDLASGIIGKRSSENILMEQPQGLSLLFEEIEKIIGESRQNKFLLIDSVSTMALYNKKEAIERFFHSLTLLCKEKKIMGIFIMIEKSELKDLKESLAQFCDKTISI